MLQLPTINSPVYEDKIISTGTPFYYRPFILKEYKALLHCISNNLSDEFINTIVAIVNSCTFNKLDINKLTVFDVDYMFMRIRSKSVSDIVPLHYVCNNMIPSKETEGHFETCGQKFTYSLDIKNIYIQNIDNYMNTQTVEISEGIFIKLKAPTFAKYRKVLAAKQDNKVQMTDELLEYAFACVDSIVHGDKIMLPDVDFTQTMFIEFIENLPTNSVISIIEFIQKLPTVASDIKLRCPKCRNETNITVKGLDDFFG